MARIKGLITITGSVGNHSYYQSKNGNIMRLKGGVSRERINEDPAFEGTRKNMTEFGYAGKAGKLLRSAFDKIADPVIDEKLSNRLMKRILQVVKDDTVNPHGERRLTNQNVCSLRQFEFNERARFDGIFEVHPEATINRESGITTVIIEPFIARFSTEAPEGSTHFKLIVAGSIIDFANNTWHTDYAETEMMAVGEVLHSPEPLIVTLEAGISLPVFTAIGIRFYQRQGNCMCEMKNRRYNAGKIIGVDVSHNSAT